MKNWFEMAISDNPISKSDLEQIEWYKPTTFKQKMYKKFTRGKNMTLVSKVICQVNNFLTTDFRRGDMNLLEMLRWPPKRFLVCGFGGAEIFVTTPRYLAMVILWTSESKIFPRGGIKTLFIWNRFL